MLNVSGAVEGEKRKLSCMYVHCTVKQKKKVNDLESVLKRKRHTCCAKE